MNLQKKSCKRFTPEEDDIIKKMFENHSLREIGEFLNRPLGSVYGRSKRLGLKLSGEELIKRRKLGISIILEKGKKHRFKKGHIPANKGKKFDNNLFPESMRKTQFKKGHLPHNTLFDGAISIRRGSKNRKGPPYKYIRLGLGKWKELHRYIWENEFGPIPKSMVIIFKDGDTLNCKLENLKMISQAENMKRNSLHYNYPEELVKTIQMHGAVKAQVTRLTKKQKNDI